MIILRYDGEMVSYDSVICAGVTRDMMVWSYCVP